MESNGIFSNTLGLEISLNHQQTTNFHNHQPSFPAAPAKQAYPFALKQRSSPISDEEELHINNLNNPTTTDDSGTGDGKKRKGSPWQRMKWTDNMVRLLIMVVFYVGDEVGTDHGHGHVHVQPPGSGTAVKKSGSGAGGVLQKKGKWKSVSKAMMERGFNVSPQQCEDKFNDLNKRYKRVNDILGKGTACKVVENQNLLESMDHIPSKLKEEVKKLLNSKHLFFREMCAYHNSSAIVGPVAGASPNHTVHHCSQPISGGEKSPNQRQKCVHSNDEEDEEDGDEDEGIEDADRYQIDDEEDDGLNNRKRSRVIENEGNEIVIHQFNDELSNVIQDLSKSVWEKRQWMKVKMMQLEEQRLGFEDQTYELEKRRLRWVKFCWSREREMELEKVRNERMQIENERMVILLRQKELELVDQ